MSVLHIIDHMIVIIVLLYSLFNIKALQSTQFYETNNVQIHYPQYVYNIIKQLNNT